MVRVRIRVRVRVRVRVGVRARARVRVRIRVRIRPGSGWRSGLAFDPRQPTLAARGARGGVAAPPTGLGVRGRLGVRLGWLTAAP